MTPESETGVLGLLLALAAALYAIAWLVAGPVDLPGNSGHRFGGRARPLGRTRHPARRHGPRAPVRRPAGAAPRRQITRSRRAVPRPQAP